MPIHSEKKRSAEKEASAPERAGWLLALIALTMTAFAANSILNRIGISVFHMNPIDFAAIRVAAGAAALSILLLTQTRQFASLWTPKRLAGALMLATYMLGFSWAYVTLDAGIGALILFAVLQVVVFGWSIFVGERIPVTRWFGALIALLGLCVLLWPSGTARLPVSGSVAMVAAGVGWAVYTLLGRGESDALLATAGNFLLCLPIVGLVALIAGGGSASQPGIATAIIAGALTSGLGYALWYRILPRIPATIAGIAQLSVPVIALLAGALLLSEPITPRLLAVAALVIGGIGLSFVKRKRYREAPPSGR